jgi:hypothetical protein
MYVRGSCCLIVYVDVDVDTHGSLCCIGQGLGHVVHRAGSISPEVDVLRLVSVGEEVGHSGKYHLGGALTAAPCSVGSGKKTQRGGERERG